MGCRLAGLVVEEGVAAIVLYPDAVGADTLAFIQPVRHLGLQTLEARWSTSMKLPLVLRVSILCQRVHACECMWNRMIPLIRPPINPSSPSIKSSINQMHPSVLGERIIRIPEHLKSNQSLAHYKTVQYTKDSPLAPDRPPGSTARLLLRDPASFHSSSRAIGDNQSKEWRSSGKLK